MKLFQLIVIVCSLFTLGCNSDTKSLDNDSIVSIWNLEETCVSPGGPDLICNAPEEKTTLEFFEDGRFELVIGSVRCEGNYERIELDQGSELVLNSIDESCRFGSNSFRITELNNSELTMNWIGCIEPCISHFSRL